jgi:hypothetical protein
MDIGSWRKTALTNNAPQEFKERVGVDKLPMISLGEPLAELSR